MKFLSITQRLSVIVGLLVLTIVGIVIAESLSFRESMIQERREKIHDMASSVIALAKHYDGEVAAGRIGLAEAKETVRNSIRAMRWGAGDYYGLYQYDGLTLVHGNPKYENVNRLNFVDGNGVRVVEATINQAKSGGGFSMISVPRAGETVPAAKVVYVTGYAPWEWALSCGAYVDDVDAIVWHRLAWVAGLAGVAALFAAGFALYIARSISRPIAGLRAAMQSLAGGDTAVTVPFTEWRHETGEIARTVEIFKASMIEGDRLRHEQEELKRRSEADTKALLTKMADEFESGVRASLDTLAAAATEMRATSQSMSATAERGQHARRPPSRARPRRPRANVQTVAAATEELSSSVSEIGRQVTESTRIAGQAVEEATRTNATVQGLVGGGAEDRRRGQADQRHRQPDQSPGAQCDDRGGAGRRCRQGLRVVVASEVKTLANQTAKATEEIAAQVAAMQGATGEAVQAIQGIGGTIGSINEIATTIASAVEEQGAATQEIARNVQEAAQGTGEVSSNIVGVNQAAAETGTAAHQVLVSAERAGQAGGDPARRRRRLPRQDPRRVSPAHADPGFSCPVKAGRVSQRPHRAQGNWSQPRTKETGSEWISRIVASRP